MKMKSHAFASQAAQQAKVTRNANRRGRTNLQAGWVWASVDGGEMSMMAAAGGKELSPRLIRWEHIWAAAAAAALWLFAIRQATLLWPK